MVFIIQVGIPIKKKVKIGIISLGHVRSLQNNQKYLILVFNFHVSLILGKRLPILLSLQCAVNQI